MQRKEANDCSYNDIHPSPFLTLTTAFTITFAFVSVLSRLEANSLAKHIVFDFLVDFLVYFRIVRRSSDDFRPTRVDTPCCS